MQHRARALWRAAETLHAVTYFASESHQAAADAGLRGFWMGYFGFRAAPLGAIDAPVVEAVFANFAPAMVRRSIPDAWSYASPSRLCEVRATAAAAALRRLVPDIEDIAEASNDQLAAVTAAAAPLGRPLFAANAALDLPDDPVERLWQLATTFREHRGDGHVATLVGEGLDGPSAHLLHATGHGTPDDVLQPNRGWSDDEWARALARLVDRGLLTDDELTGRALTDRGRVVRERIELATDELAAVPIDRALGDHERDTILQALRAAARHVADSRTIPFPNPMGLPAPGSDEPIEPTDPG